MTNDHADFMSRLTRMGLALVRAHDSQPHKIVGLEDPDRPELVIIGKDRAGLARTWVYGPYMILGGPDGIASAGLLFGFDLWDEIPGDIDHLPFDVLLKTIDEFVAEKRAKGWKPPEYLEERIRKPDSENGTGIQA